MEIPGRIQNGVVILEGDVCLPEGTTVTVLCDAAPTVERSTEQKRDELPLVQSERPERILLTNERIAEIFEEEDIAEYRKFFPSAGE
jgi:hypothetical protein